MIDLEVFSNGMQDLRNAYGGKRFEGSSVAEVSATYYRAMEDYFQDDDFTTGIGLLLKEHVYGFPSPAKIIEFINRAVRDRVAKAPKIDEHAGKKYATREQMAEAMEKAGLGKKME